MHAFHGIHRERQLAFYRAWTRKEAYLKARGEGIGTPKIDLKKVVEDHAEEKAMMEDSEVMKSKPLASCTKINVTMLMK